MKRKCPKKDDLVVVVKPWDDRISYLKVGMAVRRVKERQGHYFVVPAKPPVSFGVWIPYCYVRSNVWPEV